MSTTSLTGHKPSFYLQAMVDGLLATEEMNDFKVSMNTYGSYDQSRDTCFGCAATCTLMQLTQTPFKDFLQGTSEFLSETEARYIRATNLDLDFSTLKELERAIDYARGGELYSLFDFAGIPEKHRRYRYDGRFFLMSNGWEGYLHKVEKLIEDLKKDGC